MREVSPILRGLCVLEFLPYELGTTWAADLSKSFLVRLLYSRRLVFAYGIDRTRVTRRSQPGAHFSTLDREGVAG
jgi:hypothetical protein